MQKTSIIAMTASLVVTVASYEGYINVRLSEAYACVWRLLVYPITPESAEVKVDTFSFAEEHAVFISVAFALLLCFWACWQEVNTAMAARHSKRAASIVSLGVAILFANLQLLSWNL